MDFKRKDDNCSGPEKLTLDGVLRFLPPVLLPKAPLPTVVVTETAEEAQEAAAEISAKLGTPVMLIPLGQLYLGPCNYSQCRFPARWN